MGLKLSQKASYYNYCPLLQQLPFLKNATPWHRATLLSRSATDLFFHQRHRAAQSNTALGPRPIIIFSRHPLALNDTALLVRGEGFCSLMQFRGTPTQHLGKTSTHAPVWAFPVTFSVTLSSQIKVSRAHSASFCVQLVVQLSCFMLLVFVTIL